MNRDRLGALALAAVIVLMLVSGMYRIAPVDVPWHLQTGRLALATGHLPVTNTFSWTFPDFPLRQQYPLFQLPLAWLVDHGGFEAFEVWNLTLWTLAGLAWMRAAGSFREASAQPLLWMLVALGIQRHHVPRPEVWTLLGMGLVLLGLGQWSRSRRWGWLAVVVAAQWCMVNGHQLWIVGLGIQGAFLVDLAVARRAWAPRLGLERATDPPPMVGPAAAFVASLLVLPISPLGLGVFMTPVGVIETVLSQGEATAGGAQAQELLPVWSDPLALALFVIDLAVTATYLVRARRRWSAFELLVWGATFAMAAMAVRGIGFFTLATGWLAARVRGRVGPLLPDESLVHPVASVATLVMSLSIAGQLQTSDASYLARQAGLGRSHGEWADATVAFLRDDPPPGRLLNLSWVVGNALVELYPQQKVFVDPRFESYPKDFLLETIEGCEDPAVLAELVDTWHPTFVVAEMRELPIQMRVVELLKTGDWFLVHVDSILCVAVHREDATESWLRSHETRLEHLRIEDWVSEDEPVLLAQQRIRVARLYELMGRHDLAEPLLEQARSLADQPNVASDLETLDDIPAWQRKNGSP